MGAIAILSVALSLGPPSALESGSGPEAKTGPNPAVSDAQIVAWLQPLKPLQKVHYSFPLPPRLLEDPRNLLLYEYVRITHAACVRGESATARQVGVATAVCQAVNAAGPPIPASLAVNYSPWHRKFDRTSSPTRRGPSHQAEVSTFRNHLSAIRGWLGEANRRHQDRVRISAILLDSERFRIRKDDQVWNAALTAKYDAIYDVARGTFPDARVEWYGRGIRRGPYTTGWADHRHFTFQEKGDAFSCSLYRVPELGYTRETFKRTVELAKAHGCPEVTPWVALAAGYRRKVDKYHEWEFDWDYDPVYSHLLGREINQSWYGRHPDRFAPWDAAKVVAFYPQPFDPRTPAWGKHFVAYVRGANGVAELPAVKTTDRPARQP